MTELARRLTQLAWQAVNGATGATDEVVFTGSGGLPSVFPVTDIASAAIAAAGLSIAKLVQEADGQRAAVTVDRHLSSVWFQSSLRPIGWSLPSPWDLIAGDYRARDGWIRLHTNAPHHRAAVERVLGALGDKQSVAHAVAQWAKADLETAKANANLSRITAARYEELIKTDGVSKQEVDNAQGDYSAKQAIVASSLANVHRLEELESFKHIYAPFSGVITRRNVDTGTLINAGNGGSSQQLFALAQTDPIRVYVNVPESAAPSIRSGMVTRLELTQFPGRKIEGKVVRTAESIDPASRTLLTEIDVPNKSSAQKVEDDEWETAKRQKAQLDKKVASNVKHVSFEAFFTAVAIFN